MYLPYFKLQSTFLVGFGIGFILAILTFIVHDAFNGTSSTFENSLSNTNDARRNSLLKWLTSDTRNNEEIIMQVWKDQMLGNKSTYGQWLTDKNVRTNNIDMDFYLYGSTREQELESDWLGSNVQLTCVVFVKKVKLAKSIWNTWGKRCNNIYFFGQEKDPEVPIINLELKLVSSWQLLCEAFNYVWRDNKTMDWLVFSKDDTLVVPENLRYMLAPLNHTRDYYLGHAVVLWGQPYNVADAGYVISMAVLGKLANMFGNSEKCITGGKYWKQEDYYLAKHLASMGIFPSDTRDQYLRGTFHGYSLQSLLWGVVKTGSYWTRALYPIQNECCSLMSVTFNVGEPDKMYTLDYLLHHLYIIKKEAVFGTRRAPTAVPDEDVWKIALKEEFNITHLKNISKDAYYEIWHSKYSEPGQLMTKNDQRKGLDKPN
ncbi:PREDICTED: glycoprotein-N-acetylgalactosamine 3-beta-galactosyltransferase 1-like [Dufourea novaeangliae]|uniref:N-acetylgalactosaminide beta-1,3-galactosyltransferase n=1 Tax=Dufourea novaeangliae TaxID=178035 RepID=A0A154PBD5_DUFNO|nr:PREDICTED: glycoprotein-N-acetylgalactosamine 3-beta-galactosyltransferase 1-like [Dufourea novaeangliae]KZC09216.1 Glycoprotein-N-acetylgalactosamine 3-beta-galactosyltransferase 1-A [Dufourea novaeangliae]